MDSNATVHWCFIAGIAKKGNLGIIHNAITCWNESEGCKSSKPYEMRKQNSTSHPSHRNPQCLREVFLRSPSESSLRYSRRRAFCFTALHFGRLKAMHSVKNRNSRIDPRFLTFP